MSTGSKAKCIERCHLCGEYAKLRRSGICYRCYHEEGQVAQTVSERGRTGYRPTDTHGMIEDDYSENSRGE